MPRKGSLLREFPILVIVALAVSIVIKTFLVQFFYIPSGSMENTLQVNDRVAVNKVPFIGKSIERGDVVVFDGTDSFVPANSATTRDPISGLLVSLGQSLGVVSPDGSDFVKRVIGVAGDNVQCCDAQGRLLINGVPLEEPYLYPGDAPSSLAFDAVVPEGKLWVMGDHRSASADSRAHLGDPGGGMVPTSKVVGRVMAVVWPPSRWGSVAIPDSYAKVDK
jgi:signal peptidase I